MPRKIKGSTQSDKIKFFLFGGIAAMVIILVSMLLVRLQQQPTVIEPRINLGAMQYDFSSGKAVKRDDETVRSLKAFLVSLVERDDTLPKCDTKYNVVMASSDEKQVLLKYGCHYPSGTMFAVNENGTWRTISPTNHFDMLEIPECSYVDENKIDKILAPVCVNGLSEPGPDTYSVR